MNEEYVFMINKGFTARVGFGHETHSKHNCVTYSTTIVTLCVCFPHPVPPFGGQEVGANGFAQRVRRVTGNCRNTEGSTADGPPPV